MHHVSPVIKDNTTTFFQQHPVRDALYGFLRKTPAIHVAADMKTHAMNAELEHNKT